MQCSQWEVKANMLRAGREALGCVLLMRRGRTLGFFLFVTCVGGNYSVDSGTNKLAGVFKSVLFLDSSVQMWGLFLPVRPLVTHLRGPDRAC